MMDYLNTEEIDRLHNVLSEASLIEREFAKRKDPNTIPALYKAAGDFKSLSILIKL